MAGTRDSIGAGRPVSRFVDGLEDERVDVIG